MNDQQYHFWVMNPVNMSHQVLMLQCQAMSCSFG